MVGLDNSGKTSIIYRLKIGDFIDIKLSLGFNIEEIKYNGLNLILWGIGSNNNFYENKVRKLWKHYYQNIDGIIFVIDSKDTERFEQG